MARELWLQSQYSCSLCSYLDTEGVYSGIDAGGKVRPTSEELEQFGPAFKARWEREFGPFPDKAAVWVGFGCWYVTSSLSKILRYGLAHTHDNFTG